MDTSVTLIGPQRNPQKGPLKEKKGICFKITKKSLDRTG